MSIPSLDFQPAENYIDALNRASDLWGILRQYYDVFGNLHNAGPEMQKALLKSMGVPSDSLDQLNAAIDERFWNEWSRAVPSTIVLSVTSGAIPISIPEDCQDATAEAEFCWESGEPTQKISHALANLETESSARLRGRAFLRKGMPLPPGSPLGYHSLKILVRRGVQILSQESARLIVCPDRAYHPAGEPSSQRSAGLAVSLYGLRSHRNWGCGDFTDLRALTDWVQDDLGGSFISLNPLHAIPNRVPYNTSPYLPTCIFYRNPLYLDIEAIPDFANCRAAQRNLAADRFQQQLQALRDSKFVDYEKVYRLKLRFLRALFRQFQKELRAATPRALAFRQYVEDEGSLLHRYAVFCTLDAAIHRADPNIWIWPDWPMEYQDPESIATHDFAAKHSRSILFHKYIQWQTDLQLAAAQAYARGKGLKIGLYHDLALATDRCGSDLWAHRDFYVNGSRVGSPPDGFSPKGQDWAFPPPNSRRHRDDGYHLFAMSIRKNCRHGGALRIDHVMRFFRLFWIPDGYEALHGTYVRDNADDLLRILALESVRNQVIIVGEDLGTVEPGVRETLHRYGILSYRLLYFEKNPHGEFRSPEEYPPQSLVSVSTHDLPTLAGFWVNRDIEARRVAGLLPDEASYRSQLAHRAHEKQKLLDLFWRLHLVPPHTPRMASEIPDFNGDLHNAAIGFLANTRSELMCLNQEDLTKELDQQNLPGSTTEYPNWRRKMHFTLDELRTDPIAAACTLMFRNWLRNTGRCNS